MGAGINRGAGRNQGIEGINVTPMVDIMLVLLVIYIVASEMGQGKVPVQLPQGGAQAGQGPKAPVRVVMNAQGQIFFKGQQLSGQELQAQLVAMPRAEKTQVLLHADTKVPHGQVVELMQRLSAAGVQDLSFATQPNEAAARP